MTMFTENHDVMAHLARLETQYGTPGYDHDQRPVANWKIERRIAELRGRERNTTPQKTSLASRFRTLFATFQRIVQTPDQTISAAMDQR